jgi:hypothetical protein
MESSINSNARSSTATHFRDCRCFKIRDWIELVSNAAIPLMIGAISLWIAIHQQNIAQSNRDKDASQAAEIRKQDLVSAQLQRDEDKETTRLQRELDLNVTND